MAIVGEKDIGSQEVERKGEDRRKEYCLSGVNSIMQYCKENRLAYLPSECAHDVCVVARGVFLYRGRGCWSAGRMLKLKKAFEGQS